MIKKTSSRLFTAVAAFTLLASTSAHAADLTWDTTIVADGTITDGSGTWTTGAGNWNDTPTTPTSVGINWVDGDSATFGGGTEGTAGTAAVDTTFSPLSVKARFIRLVDHVTSGITYTAQFSNDLSFWQDVDGSTGVRITGTSAQGDYEVVDVDYPLFLTNGKKAQFFRLSINDVNSGSVEP